MLLASVTLPVLAVSWTVLDPADYVSTSNRSDDDIVTVVYRFGIDPLISYKLNFADGTGNYQGSCNGSFQTPVGDLYSLSLSFSLYPLGASVNQGSPLSNFLSGGIAIDARDFKPNAAVTINSNITVQADYYHTTDNEPTVTEYVGMTVRYKLFGYDLNGKYVGCVENNKNEVFGVSSGTSSPYTLRLSETLSLSDFGTEVRYIVPYFFFGTNNPGSNPNLCVRNFRITCQDYNITTTTDMLLKDSLTMQAIENQLEDLNDKQDQTNEKLDDILHADDAQVSRADEEQERVNGTAQDIDQTLTDLEELEDYNTSSALQTITNFLDSTGWTDLKNLLQPLLEWEHTATIMLAVTAFSTVSVLFFGR